MTNKMNTGKIIGYSLLIFTFFIQSTVSKAQMVGPNAYIKATSVEIGLSGQGGFEGASTIVSPPLPGMHPRSSGASLFGFVANPAVDGWATQDGDFFVPGSPENGWGLEIGTTMLSPPGNNCTGEFDIPGAIMGFSHDFDCHTIDWEGDYTGGGSNLHVKLSYLVREFDLYYTTTVSITNNTSATIPDLYYYRNVDPDNNQSISGDFTTQNTIVSQPTSGCGLAHVKGTSSVPASQPLSYVGFAGAGSEFRVSKGGFSNRDASDIWNGTGGLTGVVGSTSFLDEAISIAYRIQNLAPGATETFKFVTILDDASAANAINNLLYFTYVGSGSTPPSTCSVQPDTVRTCGDSVLIGINGSIVSDFTWSWTPSGGLVSTTGPTTTAFPSTTTTYSVTGTPITGCFSPVTLSVVIEVTPSAGNSPVITYVPPICVSDPPFNLTVDTLGGIWSGTGITNPSTGTFSPGGAGPGSYVITYVTPGMCNTTDTTLITVDPVADPTITSVPPVCVGDAPFNLVAATNGGVWSGPGITDSLAGTFDPATATVGTHTITYTITSGLCSAVDSITITVVNLFDVTISPIAPLCVGSSSFNMTTVTGGGVWSGTGITSATLGTFNPSVAGTAVVTYTLSGGCGNTDTVHVVVVPYEDATITAPAAVCVGAPAFNMSAVDPGGVWSGTGITSSSAGTFDPSVSGAGTFTITYTITALCGDTDNQTVTVNALPTPAFTSNVVSGCEPLCVQFNEAFGTNCVTVLYDFGDGVDTAVADPLHCFFNSGVFDVTITCTDVNNCTGTTMVSNYITVYEVPNAGFTVSPLGISEPGNTITFTDVSTGGGVPYWDFDDPASGVDSIGSGSPVTHVFGNEGTYCVTLIANNNGCVDTANHCVIIMDDATIFIPNVFTPNNDGDNDSWYVTHTGVKNLTCEIYDRWGLKIATFDGTTSAWDGKTKGGALSADGTYYYILNVVAFNEKVTKKQGYLQLLRDK